MKSITIPHVDPEFLALIPRLRPEERKLLEANILAEGCRDPLAVWGDEGILLDGHNRLNICTAHDIDFETVTVELSDRAHALLWIELNQLGRRNLTDDQRVGIAKRIKDRRVAIEKSERARKAREVGGDCTPEQKKDRLEAQGASKRSANGEAESNGKSRTRAAVAREAKVSEKHLRKLDVVVKAVEKTQGAEAARQVVDQVVSGEVTIKQAKKEAVAAVRAAAKDAAVREAPSGGDIHTGDMSLLFDLVPDDTADLFFTDPPYHEIHTDLFGRLAELAQRKLKPGGLCLVYSGQMFLPTVLEKMSEHLDYYWLFTLKHTGGHLQIWNRKVWNDWKPILVFAKRPVTTPSHDWVNDFLAGGGRDKQYHEWGQDAQEATFWIEKLTPPGGLVVDPFVGGGSIPAACKATGRSWIGTEIDPGNAATARKRVGV